MNKPSLLAIDIRTIIFVVFSIVFLILVIYLIVKGIQAINELNKRKNLFPDN